MGLAEDFEALKRDHLALKLDLDRLEGAGREMRDAQKEFYDPKRKTGASLSRAKAAERKFDRVLKELDRDEGPTLLGGFR
jgi:hypothetical protein